MTTDNIPVRALCAATGLNPNTLRTWERRYGFPSPPRGTGGQRGYTPEDVERVRQMVALVNEGMSPGDAVAQLRKQGGSRKAAAPKRSTALLHRDLLAAAQRLDYPGMQRLTQSGLQQLGYADFIEQVGFPILGELGHVWELSGSGVAVEHLFTLLLEGILLSHRNRLEAPDAPVVTIACVPGELHQLPVIHLANLLLDKQIANPVVLAAGLPLVEVLSVATMHQSRLIVLSATMSPSAAETRQWIGECEQAGWVDRLVLAGPGFMRSRIYADYPIRAAAGGFSQAVTMLQTALAESAQ